ncbi:MAG: HEAT repeat domain-containing protein [Brasilonema sp.]
MSGDFQKYLQSVCNAYQHWWRLYTITDVEGSKPAQRQSVSSPFGFDLMVQTVQPQQQDKGETAEKTERLPVQEGLRKYTVNHVLLVGRPGSGKSTALARLLLEEARNSVIASAAKRNVDAIAASRRVAISSTTKSVIASAAKQNESISSTTKIPILVELRQYNTSVFELIQNFLLRHDPNLTFDSETLKTWLRQGQFLLLVDGVNELPNEDARRDLKTFRQNYQHTPMIFTTRDLGVGGDLGIEKKLEMQPLTEGQMQQFVRAYLPEKGEEMLRRLGGRLREFGQTPLLLWMLCELFRTTGNVPPNLGLVFRCFAQSYSALGSIVSNVAIPALIQALQDKESLVRSSAASALGGTDSDTAITALIQALQDEDSLVRSSAVSALGEIGSDEAVCEVIKALQDEDCSVRISVISFLENTDYNVPTSVLI